MLKVGAWSLAPYPERLLHRHRPLLFWCFAFVHYLRWMFVVAIWSVCNYRHFSCSVFIASFLSAIITWLKSSTRYSIRWSFIFCFVAFGFYYFSLSLSLHHVYSFISSSFTRRFDWTDMVSMASIDQHYSKRGKTVVFIHNYDYELRWLHKSSTFFFRFSFQTHTRSFSVCEHFERPKERSEKRLNFNGK